jgi:hypothetical protein
MGWPSRENGCNKDSEKGIRFKMCRKEIRLFGSVFEDSEEIGKKLKRQDSEKQGELGDVVPTVSHTA